MPRQSKRRRLSSLSQGGENGDEKRECNAKTPTRKLALTRGLPGVTSPSFPVGVALANETAGGAARHDEYRGYNKRSCDAVGDSPRARRVARRAGMLRAATRAEEADDDNVENCDPGTRGARPDALVSAAKRSRVDTTGLDAEERAGTGGTPHEESVRCGILSLPDTVLAHVFELMPFQIGQVEGERPQQQQAKQSKHLSSSYHHLYHQHHRHCHPPPPPSSAPSPSPTISITLLLFDVHTSDRYFVLRPVH
jgi:hypothetical protein